MRRYAIQYSTLINRKNLKRIPKADRRTIKEAIAQKLMTSPEIFGKPLRFSLKGHRSLRVGDYRVIFRIDGATVRILLIAHRSAVYDAATGSLSGKQAA
jgi:mRNA interferase RelE/StbE